MRSYSGLPPAEQIGFIQAICDPQPLPRRGRKDAEAGRNMATGRYQGRLRRKDTIDGSNSPKGALNLLGVILVNMLENRPAFLLIHRGRISRRQPLIQHILDSNLNLRPGGGTIAPTDDQLRLDRVQ